MTDDWTLAELQHGIARIERIVERDGAKLDQLTLDMATMKEGKSGAHERMNERLAAIEAWQTWALRLIVGLVLTAVVGLVLISP